VNGRHFCTLPTSNETTCAARPASIWALFNAQTRTVLKVPPAANGYMLADM
jgi:hypothetical protein